MRTSGKVQSFDQGDRTISIENGPMFHVGPSVDLTAIRTGELVTLDYDEPAPGNTPIVDSVTKASAVPKEAPSPTPPPAPPRHAVNTTTTLKGKKA